MKFKTAFKDLYKTLAIQLERQGDKFKEKEVMVEISQWHKPRSNDQNKMLWGIIGKMAIELESTDDEIYLQMLKDYGVSDYLAFKSDTENINAIMKSLKYCEIENSPLENAKRLKVYIGSSNYNTKQFTRLLNGIIDECKQLGIYEEIKQDSEEIKSLLKAV